MYEEGNQQVTVLVCFESSEDQALSYGEVHYFVKDKDGFPVLKVLRDTCMHVNICENVIPVPKDPVMHAFLASSVLGCYFKGVKETDNSKFIIIDQVQSNFLELLGKYRILKQNLDIGFDKILESLK